ncbi:MAG TPA: hypothetical protein VGQ06_12795 [Gemmatimonadales bacterium]|jgi:hypothetical protein|nr:hypothetical protein [Gemmatimonadales bacterium]
MFRNDRVRRWLSRTGMAVVAAVLPIGGCDSGILEVTDPDIILSANNAAGARGLRNGAFLRLSQAVSGTQGPDAVFVFSGLLTDEYRSGDTFVQRNNQDQRIFWPENTFNAGPFRNLNRVRAQSEQAIKAFQAFLPDSFAAMASMFALIGYSETLIGELYCNGTPLSRVEGTTFLYGNPLTNDSVIRLAVANVDSALALAAATIARADAILANPAGQDTAYFRQERNLGLRLQNLAAIVKGRALVDLARSPADFAAAASAVAVVPTTYKYHVHHSLTSSTNQVWGLNNNARRYTMTNGREGNVGIDYVTPNDPRLPRTIGGATVFDTSIPMTLVRQAMWGQFDSIPIATGVEARLIEAEAMLQAGDSTGWLAAINALRTNAALYPPIGSGLSASRGATLTALANPTTDSARVRTHFTERAFWMFSTGHRLGDMRRMLRQYGTLGFTELNVYPNGAYVKGGTFGDAIQMPVPFDEYNNPNFNGCINRNP